MDDADVGRWQPVLRCWHDKTAPTATAAGGEYHSASESSLSRLTTGERVSSGRSGGGNQPANFTEHELIVMAVRQNSVPAPLVN